MTINYHYDVSHVTTPYCQNGRHMTRHSPISAYHHSHAPPRAQRPQRQRLTAGSRLRTWHSVDQPESGVHPAAVPARVLAAAPARLPSVLANRVRSALPHAWQSH